MGYKVKETGLKVKISKVCLYADGYGTEVSDDTVLRGEQIMKETSPSEQCTQVACGSPPGHRNTTYRARAF